MRRAQRGLPHQTPRVHAVSGSERPEDEGSVPGNPPPLAGGAPHKLPSRAEDRAESGRP